MTRAYSRYAKEAALLLGKEIEFSRKGRRFSASDFARRVGISRITLQKIEKGDLRCELGLVLEAAALAGVRLFGVDPPGGRNPFAASLDRLDDKLALLPRRIRVSDKKVDDAF